MNNKASIDKKKIIIPANTVKIWQNLLDIIADSARIPAALVMKVELPCIKVFLASKSKGNPYKIGDSEHLIGSGFYCERVFKTKEKLYVSNALKDKDWDKNPDIKLGLISYLGFPILWPDGEVFGTICMLDVKEIHFKKKHEKTVLLAKKHIETELDLLVLKYRIKNKLIDIETGREQLREKEQQCDTIFSEIMNLLYRGKPSKW